MFVFNFSFIKEQMDTVSVTSTQIQIAVSMWVTVSDFTSYLCCHFHFTHATFTHWTPSPLAKPIHSYSSLPSTSNSLPAWSPANQPAKQADWLLVLLLLFSHQKIWTELRSRDNIAIYVEHRDTSQHDAVINHSYQVISFTPSPSSWFGGKGAVNFDPLH